MYFDSIFTEQVTIGSSNGLLPNKLQAIITTNVGQDFTGTGATMWLPQYHLSHPEAWRWRHKERDGVSNHQSRNCLRYHLFRHRSKKTSKLRVTGLCAGNSPVTSEFPSQRTSNAENVSIWRCHHEFHHNVMRWSHFSIRHQIKKLKCFLSCHAVVFAQFIEARC